ncbi:hypothetical protein [Rhizobium nepotum]|uniref:Uncharacterized protein n=1 Tax=Rhizobium nepotum 39/7 TaxID=1368418 RepID=A0ABR5CKG7_9HYPH|nr:hypothetical protein RS75_23480 [Rhizobium nepotum 39/7]
MTVAQEWDTKIAIDHRAEVPFAGFSYGFLTGMTVYRMVASVDDARADQALYAAKEKGRDRLLAVTA